MKKQNDGTWTAVSPLDLIGWNFKVKTIVQVLPFLPPTFILEATRNDGKEVREVYAEITAIPIEILEANK